MKRTAAAILTAGTILAIAGASRAATITFVGSDVDGTQSAWRTAASNAYDIDANNEYGTGGYLMGMFSYHVGSLPAIAYDNTFDNPNRLNPTFGTLEWAHTDWGGNFGDFNDAQWENVMDHPLAPGTHSYGGMWGGEQLHLQ